MKDQLVSFETAKLANDKMCSVECSIYIEPLSKVSNHVHVGYKQPTQSLLQKWLREEHKIYIEIRYNMDDLRYNSSDESYHFIVIKAPTITKKNRSNYIEHPGFLIYEDALEYALQQALNLI